MSALPRIAVVVGSVRENRFGLRAAEWLLRRARERSDAEFELVDLKDYDLPIFSAAASPAHSTNTDPVAQRWGRRIAAFDGYLFVVAEYNRSITGALKNALDHLYPELTKKAAGCFGYGSVGGARAVEHLRLMCVEFQMVPVRQGIHLGGQDFFSVAFGGGKAIEDLPYLAADATKALDQLVWWTAATRAARLADGLATG